MTRACHGPMRAATGDAFTDEELDDILARLQARHERVKGKAAGASDRAAMEEAAAEMTREAVMDALIERRRRAVDAASDLRRAKIMAALPGNPFEKRMAYEVGSEKQGGFTGFSGDAEAVAEVDGVMARVEAGLRQEPGLFDRISNAWFSGEKGFDELVSIEMARLAGATLEPTRDRGAEIAALVFRAGQNRVRKLQNDAGAWIGELPGYIARQMHDRLKVSGGFWNDMAAGARRGKMSWTAARLQAARLAFRVWHDFIRPLLDDDLTFGDLRVDDLPSMENAAELHTAGVLADPTDLKERFLYHAWWNIVSGGGERLGGAGDRAAISGRAAAVSRERVLHFKPEKWMVYHDRFGRGSLFSVIAGELERGAQNAVLMRRWGTNPDAAQAADLERALGEAKANADLKAASELQGWKLRAAREQTNGLANAPENLRLAIIGRTIRWDQSVSKLGGMVLSAIGGDQGLAAQAMKRAGGKFLDGYTSAFGGILRLEGADRRSAAAAMDVGARAAMAALTGRFKATDGPLGWMASTSRLFYRINGFDFVAEGQRHGMAAGFAKLLGDEAANPIDRLSAGTRETLERYGIGGPEWELIRAGAAKIDDGETYLTFEAIEAIPDEKLLDWRGATGDARTAEAAGRAREELGLRFRAMVGDFLDNTLTEPRARERALLTWGTRPGTRIGEFVRAFTQFWSFPTAVIGRHVVPAARGYAGQAPVALLAHLIVASAVGGYFSLQAKQIMKGRTSRPILNEDDELEFIKVTDDGFALGQTGSVFLASLLQGGGLGIYGDFLFGEVNRSGRAFGVSAIAGPAIGEGEAMVQILRDAINGDWEDLGADTVKLGVRNTPFVNLWYSRWALDYLILWRLQEALSPGYLERYQRRVEENEGSSFIINPSEAVQ